MVGMWGWAIAKLGSLQLRSALGNPMYGLALNLSIQSIETNRIAVIGMRPPKYSVVVVVGKATWQKYWMSTSIYGVVFEVEYKSCLL